MARGLVLPLTVLLSSTSLQEPTPSLNALLACATVSLGFLIGVIVDSPTSDAGPALRLSTLGIVFGLLSSTTTAIHAIIIKRALATVRGNPLELAWYSNVLTAAIMLPVVMWVEGPRAMIQAVSDSSAAAFVLGSSVTVRVCLCYVRATQLSSGDHRFSHFHRWVFVYQGHFTRHPYDCLCGQRSHSDAPINMVVPRHCNDVGRVTSYYPHALIRTLIGDAS